jgi:transposase-like protein
MSSQTPKYTPQFKAKVVLELVSGERTNAEACRHYNIHRSVITRWRAEFLERAAELFTVPDQINQDQARIAELEQMVGKLTMKLEIAQKASAYLQTTKNKRW